MGAWRSGEEKLRSFINDINKNHPTIKFTVEWSKTSINFLDVTVSIAEGTIEIDLSSSCHPFYCKKGIPYSQALRLNRICSNNKFFDKRCNDLEKYLLDRGYSERMVRKEILRARAIPRDTLLGKVNNQKNNKIMFNITYHPVFRNVKKILEEMHVILAPDDRHSEVFPDVSLIGFKNSKSLRDHLVRSRLSDTEETGMSKLCGGKRPPCHLCKNMKNKCTFKSKHFNELYKINNDYNCNSKMAVYFIVYFITLIDRADTLKELRKKELYWILVTSIIYLPLCMYVCVCVYVCVLLQVLIIEDFEETNSLP